MSTDETHKGSMPSITSPCSVCFSFLHPSLLQISLLLIPTSSDFSLHPSTYRHHSFIARTNKLNKSQYGDGSSTPIRLQRELSSNSNSHNFFPEQNRSRNHRCRSQDSCRADSRCRSTRQKYTSPRQYIGIQAQAGSRRVGQGRQAYGCLL